MQKTKHAALPVYVITKTGVGLNDEGVQAVRDLVFKNGSAGPAGYAVTDKTTGILAITGKHLLDPAILAAALGKAPTARVVLSVRDGKDLILCGYGPDDKGLPGVIKELEQGAGTSWEILSRAAGRKGDAHA